MLDLSGVWKSRLFKLSLRDSQASRDTTQSSAKQFSDPFSNRRSISVTSLDRESSAHASYSVSGDFESTSPQTSPRIQRKHGAGCLARKFSITLAIAFCMARFGRSTQSTDATSGNVGPLSLKAVVTLYASIASRACDVVALRYPSCKSIYSELLRKLLYVPVYTCDFAYETRPTLPCTNVFFAKHSVAWKETYDILFEDTLLSNSY